MKCWCQSGGIRCFQCWMSGAGEKPAPPCLAGPSVQQRRETEIAGLEARLAVLTRAYVENAPEFTLKEGKLG